jgi:DNA-binding NarL/FixJ family response regulator
MNTSVNILIADDHQLFLDGLQLIFDNHPYYHIVAVAQHGEDVKKCFSQHAIQLALIDINMPVSDGFECCAYIQKNHPDCKIIILSMYHDTQFVHAFLKSGASAYVLKNAGKTELLNAMDIAIKGGQYISKEIESNIALLSTEDDFVKRHKLTSREIQIIQLLASEKSSQEIAEILFLSVYTVNTHRKNILQKLGLKNAAGLIRFASENQLI